MLFTCVFVTLGKYGCLTLRNLSIFAQFFSSFELEGITKLNT